jgi:hypothetical protein
MQKAIRSEKPISAEATDKLLEAREKESRKQVNQGDLVKATDSAAKARATCEKLDRDYESDRLAQARREQSNGE